MYVYSIACNNRLASAQLHGHGANAAKSMISGCSTAAVTVSRTADAAITSKVSMCLLPIDVAFATTVHELPPTGIAST